MHRAGARRLGASVAVLSLACSVLAAAQGCGGLGASGRGAGDASASSSGEEGSVPGASSGSGSSSASIVAPGMASGGASGTPASSGTGSSTGSSSGSSSDRGCPPQIQSSSSCFVDGQVCHYGVGGGQGPTDCGCSSGVWQCYSGCSPSLSSHDIDRAQCQPQLQTTTTCHPYGSVCEFTFELPCWGDGGAQLDVDAGLSECEAGCMAVRPPGFQGSIDCRGVKLVDAGSNKGSILVGQCAACGF